MAIDLSNKRVILIHGLASKPPEADLHALWSKCLVANVKMSDPALADALAADPGVFRSGYWANATPSHIEDDTAYVRKLKVQVDKVIADRHRAGDKFHVGTGEKLNAFFKNRGMDVVKLLAGALTVKDDVMKTYLRETELYSDEQYIADRIREPLENALREAWDERCDVAILSHSMGTFIAYDVLWRFSHRNVEGFHKYRNKRVQMFATMGSPLGDPTVRAMLFSRFHGDHRKRQYPTNIDRWHNYACLGDVVSHYHDFDQTFFADMRRLKLLPDKPRHRAIDYASLHNPFVVVEHSGNKGREKRNPHKSYGYLVQPRLGSWLTDFLKGKLR